MSQFFAMGGYGVFVWPAYGITTVVLLALLISTLMRLKRNRRRVAELESGRREAKSES
ncbi:MAG: heme exporter protein CcmD [Kiloniellales bacterium]|nr:heme exporter protein CcmD [Kiloniellales bacterium]